MGSSHGVVQQAVPSILVLAHWGCGWVGFTFSGRAGFANSRCHSRGSRVRIAGVGSHDGGMVESGWLMDRLVEQPGRSSRLAFYPQYCFLVACRRYVRVEDRYQTLVTPVICGLISTLSFNAICRNAVLNASPCEPACYARPERDKKRYNVGYW